MKRITAGPAMPPIGFTAPPDTASPQAVVWIAVLTFAAIVACVLALANYDAIERYTALPSATDAGVFPKDASRCCDANGNQWIAR